MKQVSPLSPTPSLAATLVPENFPSNLERQIGRLLNHMDATGSNRSENTASRTVRLPKLDLSKFKGDLRSFKQFWDSFEVAIHNNSALQAVEKMNYLLSYLEGDAKAAISGLSVTNESYPVAVNLLRERFGNTQTQVSALYSRLMNLPSATNSTTKLRQLYDELKCVIRSLGSLNQPVDGPQLISIIKSKLPKEILLALERSKDIGQIALLSRCENDFKPEFAPEKLSTSMPPKCQTLAGRISSSYREQKRSTGEALLGESRSRTHSSAPRNAPKSIFCEGSHYSDECRRVTTMQARKEKIRGRCFICFKKNHMANQCKVDYPCAHCGEKGKHHRSLCPKKFGPKRETAAVANEAEEEKNTEKEIRNKSEESALLDSWERVLLQTATATVKNRNNRKTVNVLFDSGCNRLYITTALAKQMWLKMRMGDSIRLNRFATRKTKDIDTQEAEINLIFENGSEMSLYVSVVPEITGAIQCTAVNLKRFEKILRDRPLADRLPTKNAEKQVDLLIGNDYYLDIITGEKVNLRNGLWLLGSHLGYILSGRVPESRQRHEKECCMFGFSQKIAPNMQFVDRNFVAEDSCLGIKPNFEQFWSLEAIGTTDCPKEVDDDVALQKFNETVKVQDGRYQVAWPWKNENTELPENFQLAFGRLQSLSRKLKKDPELLDKYNKIIVDQEKKGIYYYYYYYFICISIVEKVTEETKDGPLRHYIPHQAVITPFKSTTKIRIVYDASAKSKRSNQSLNDCLYRGPVFLPDLTALLLRFRIHDIAIIADLEKAFFAN